MKKNVKTYVQITFSEWVNPDLRGLRVDIHNITTFCIFVFCITTIVFLNIAVHLSVYWKHTWRHVDHVKESD